MAEDKIFDQKTTEKNTDHIKQIKMGMIKEELQAAEDISLPFFIEKYEADDRVGVQKLVEIARIRLQKYEEEVVRIHEMGKYERMYPDAAYICGVDEVGRGPLAGPIMAGAVILPKDCEILYINDSKQLSAAKREELYDIIMREAIATGIGSVSPQVIDEKGITYANFEAMRLAIKDLGVTPDILLNDAVIIPEIDIPQVKIIKGDAKSISIGAASIIAKVTRDRLMAEYDKEYPGYGFAKHAGYGTKAHRAAIRELGVTPIHRRSYLKKKFADLLQ